MRRKLLWAVGLILGVPLGLALLAVLIVLVGANTGPGRRLIENQAASLTSGTVHLAGLSGRFPDDLHLARIELHDTQGTWLAIDNLHLDWSPLALIGKRVSVQTLTASRIDVERTPVSTASTPATTEPTKSGPGPNFGVDLHHLAIDTLHVGPSLMNGAAPNGADLAITGRAKLATIAPLFAGISVETLPNSDIALAVTRKDAPGAIGLTALVDHPKLALHLSAEDPDRGLVTALGHLPALDPLSLKLDLDGPRTATALNLALSAGPQTARLTAAAHGTADLETMAGTLALRADAPAMSPVAGVSWQSLHLDLASRGPFSRPTVDGTAHIATLAAGGATIDAIDAKIDSQAAADALAGLVRLHATLAGVHLPGPQPELVAAHPIEIDALAHLDQPHKPVTLTVAHPLIGLAAQTDTAPSITGTAKLTLPDLAPLAAAGGVQLAGSTVLDATYDIASDPAHGARRAIGLDGRIDLTGGMPQAVGLIGHDGHLVAKIVQTQAPATPDTPAPPADIAIQTLTLDGAALHVDLSGTDNANVLDLAANAALPKLAALSPALRGALTAKAHLSGPTTDLGAHVEASGDPGAATLPQGRLHAVIDATHLPGAPDATVALDGTLDRAPLHLAARLDTQADGTRHIVLSKLDWKSARGTADLNMAPKAAIPLGSVDLAMSRLSDLAPLVGQPVSGSLSARLRTEQSGAVPRVLIDLHANDAGLPTARVGRLALTGHVDDPTADPKLDLALNATGIAAGSIGGQANLTLRGPKSAFAMVAHTALTGAIANSNGPGLIDAALVLDAVHSTVALGRLTATAKDERLALTAPAKLSYGKETAIDHLHLTVVPAAGGASPAQVDIAGRIAPTLDLNATLANITPALARPFAPTLDATGVIAARAHLTGTTAKPSGNIHLTATSMKMASGPAAAIPAANLIADVDLAGTLARLRAGLTAGRDIDLHANGTVPLPSAGPSGQLALRLTGPVDLALANPIVEQQGRHVTGQLTLDLGVAGTLSAPSVNGSVRLANGSVADYAQGVRLTAMTALVTAAGKSLTLSNFDARAGDGHINANGTVGVLEPQIPVDLHITAKNARPLSSDLLTAVLDADLRIHGLAQGNLAVGGTVKIDSASINVPNSLPASVAKLNVIRPGQKPPPPTPPSATAIALALVLNAPGQIFIRGHGLDAELGGKLTVGGTTTAPQVAGGFELRHGTFDLVGTRLTFTRGKVGFNGTGVTGRLDPSLDFLAESAVGSTTARLHVGGYASTPKIDLSSSPPLPQDQILALLLFGETSGKMSAFQAAQVAAALAELSGVGGGGSTLNSIRSGLGLDRLSIGGGNNGTGASVEAGRYVARGVYVGAKQATSGGGTSAQVQIDLTKRLKLATQVGTGGPTTGAITPENDPGTSVALKYQFNY